MTHLDDTGLPTHLAAGDPPYPLPSPPLAAKKTPREKSPTRTSLRSESTAPSSDSSFIVETSGETVDGEEEVEPSDEEVTEELGEKSNGADFDDEDTSLEDADLENTGAISTGAESTTRDLDGGGLLDGEDLIEREGRLKRKGRSASLAKVSKGGLGGRDPLQIYMREIQGHPLLSREEETELAIRYAEEDDVDAAARLVTSNLRLVVKLAYEYRRAQLNMMDLIQEGNMGLMQAVKKYDPYRGVKLSSYAAWWIRAYMLRYILANWRMVKLGTTQAQRKLFFNLNKEKARLSALGIEPTSSEIANRLDVTVSEVEEMDKRMARSDASLDTPVNESDGRQIARVELMPAVGTSPAAATESAQLGRLLREHLSEFRKDLAGKDLIIFDERLIADDPRTLQDLGNQFGVSRERVRQLEARMTGKLRKFLSDRMGDSMSMTH